MSDERDAMIEAVVSAYRYRGADGVIRPAPEWKDLEPAEREEAARQAERQRWLEAALDEEGLSSTGRSVLRQILDGEPGQSE